MLDKLCLVGVPSCTDDDGRANVRQQLPELRSDGDALTHPPALPPSDCYELLDLVGNPCYLSGQPLEVFFFPRDDSRFKASQCGEDAAKRISDIGPSVNEFRIKR